MSESTTTDLYRYFDADDRLLYVGISFSAVARAAQHRADKGWWQDVARMTVEHLPTRKAAEAAERTAIIDERPIHNIIHARSYGATRQHRVIVPPKLMNPWACMYCGRGCGKTTEDAFIQIDTTDHWWVLCAQCDDNPTPMYWIDACRIADVEAITRWTLHLAEKSWFDWGSWYSLIETHSNILSAKEHAYGAIEGYRARRWGAA